MPLNASQRERPLNSCANISGRLTLGALVCLAQYWPDGPKSGLEHRISSVNGRHDVGHTVHFCVPEDALGLDASLSAISLTPRLDVKR